MGGRSGSGLCLDGYLFGGGLEQVLNSYCISLNCMHPKLPFVEHFKTFQNFFCVCGVLFWDCIILL